MKRVLIANNLFLHVRSEPGHLFPLIHATKAAKNLYFDVFQVKRDAIKSNLSSGRLPTSIYWLTTSGFQFTPSKHVG